MTITGSGTANASIRSKLACPVSGAKQLINDLANARRQTFDGTRREGLVDERAEARVGRCVEQEHAGLAGSVWHVEDAHVRARVRFTGVDGHRSITQQALDIVAAREHPALDDVVVVHGLALAQTRQYRIRIRAKRWVERSELNAGRNVAQRIGSLFVGHDIPPTQQLPSAAPRARRELSLAARSILRHRGPGVKVRGRRASVMIGSYAMWKVTQVCLDHKRPNHSTCS